MSNWHPHGYCVLWDPSILTTQISGDALVALAYASIPIGLFWAARKHKDLVIRPILLLFGFFILFCGGGHAIDIFLVWHPWYWFKASWNLAGTAVFSWASAIAILPRLPDYVRALSRPVDIASLESRVSIEMNRLITENRLLREQLREHGIG